MGKTQVNICRFPLIWSEVFFSMKNHLQEESDSQAVTALLLLSYFLRGIIFVKSLHGLKSLGRPGKTVELSWSEGGGRAAAIKNYCADTSCVMRKSERAETQGELSSHIVSLKHHLSLSLAHSPNCSLHATLICGIRFEASSSPHCLSSLPISLSLSHLPFSD